MILDRTHRFVANPENRLDTQKDIRHTAVVECGKFGYECDFESLAFLLWKLNLSYDYLVESSIHSIVNTIHCIAYGGTML